MNTKGAHFPDSQRWFGYRPDSYGPDICPEYSLAGRVRGTCRRYAIQNAYDRDKIDSLPPRLFEETLPLEEIEAMEKGDRPNHASGERLPRLEPDEVEIARVICWALKHAPVIAVYVRPGAGDGEAGYRLRLVSEFPTEITSYPATIPGPLSLGKLIDLFDHAKFGNIQDPGVLHRYLVTQVRLGEEHVCGLVWYVAMLLVNRGLNPDRLPSAILPVSAYYPNLELTYRLGFMDWAQREGAARRKGTRMKEE